MKVKIEDEKIVKDVKEKTTRRWNRWINIFHQTYKLICLYECVFKTRSY